MYSFNFTLHSLWSVCAPLPCSIGCVFEMAPLLDVTVSSGLALSPSTWMLIIIPTLTFSLILLLVWALCECCETKSSKNRKNVPTDDHGKKSSDRGNPDAKNARKGKAAQPKKEEQAKATPPKTDGHDDRSNSGGMSPPPDLRFDDPTASRSEAMKDESKQTERPKPMSSERTASVSVVKEEKKHGKKKIEKALSKKGRKAKLVKPATDDGRAIRRPQSYWDSSRTVGDEKKYVKLKPASASMQPSPTGVVSRTATPGQPGTSGRDEVYNKSFTPKLLIANIKSGSASASPGKSDMATPPKSESVIPPSQKSLGDRGPEEPKRRNSDKDKKMGGR